MSAARSDDKEKIRAYRARVLKKGAPGPSGLGAKPKVEKTETEQERARKEATKILDKARQEARQILEAAKAEAETALESVRLEAERKAAAKILEVTGQLHRDIADVEPALVDLVIECVRRMVGGRPSVSRAKQLVSRGLAEFRDDHHIIVKVPPGDLKDMQKAVDGLNMADRKLVGAVEEDPRLGAGECRLECGSSALEIGLDSQLHVLKNLLTPVAG